MAQDCKLALWHKTQRFETPGPFSIVFEYKPLVVESVKQLFGNRVVGTLTVPHALPVATTDVNAKGHAGEIGDNFVVRFDGTLHVGPGIFASGTHGIDGSAIDIGSISRAIDPYILATSVG